VIARLLKPLVERSPLLAAVYRQWRDSRGLRHPLQRSRLGFLFSGNQTMIDGSFEPAETALVQRLLGQAEVLVNVGANIGYYCCIALQAGKRVVAFEPIDLNAAYLLRHVQANGWDDRFELFPMALGARTGIVEIFGGGTGASLVPGWAGNRRDAGTRVPLSTLDTVIAARFGGQRCLLIVDIEGAELGMLQGAAAMLARQPKPVWLVEITVGEHLPAGQRVNPNLAETFALFFAAGYAAVTADGAPRPVDMAEIDAIAAGGPDTLGTHNFLFFDPADPPDAIAS
jgi:FkbM family methyltransferase